MNTIPTKTLARWFSNPASHPLVIDACRRELYLRGFLPSTSVN
jgi:hypothetical protein